MIVKSSTKVRCVLCYVSSASIILLLYLGVPVSGLGHYHLRLEGLESPDEVDHVGPRLRPVPGPRLYVQVDTVDVVEAAPGRHLDTV